MKKIMALGLAVVFMVSMVLTGCGKSAGTGQEEAGKGGKVKIRFASWDSAEDLEDQQKLVDAFNEQHDDIEVVLEAYGSDFDTKIAAGMGSGDAPDVMYMWNYPDYYEGLEPLDDYLAKEGEDFKADFYETLWNYNSMDGKIYGIPVGFTTHCLFYNKDLFDQAGVTYPTDDWTQDDVQNAAEKIRALGDDIFGIWQPITYNEFFKVVAQYGGSLLNEDKTQFTINSEENIKAAQTLVDRVLVSNVQPNSVQQGGMGDWDMFMSGRLGMIPTGIWAFQTFTENCDFAWDIAVEPGSTQKATHFFSNCVVMNPETEHPEEVAEWLAWLTSSTESADIRLAAGWDLPALKDLNALSSYLEITPPDNRKAVFESLDYLVMPPVIEDYALMSDIIGQYLSAAADGTMTVTDALNTAQADCEAQITLG